MWKGNKPLLLSLCLFFSSLFSEEKLTSKYVSCYGFATSCDIGPFVVGKPDRYLNSDPKEYLHMDEIKSGDVVWIQSYFVYEFSRDYLPKLTKPIVLVIHMGDESFPTTHLEFMDIEPFIANENIIHIFAQNCDYTGPHMDKVSCLPIGIDIHTLANGGGAFDETKQTPEEQEIVLDSVVKSLRPTTVRKKRALIEFHHHDTIADGWPNVERYLAPGENRVTIAEKLKSSGVVDIMAHRLKRRDYWRLKGQYAFSICPPGNGLDTLRAWEDMILGSIIIVKSSPMDRLFEGLPVVIIQDWSEINKENFDKWLKQFGDVFHNPDYREKITLRYWMNKIRNVALPYKEGN